MNTPLMNHAMTDAACQASQTMGGMMGNMGQIAAQPLATGAMMAAGGYAAGKGLLGAGTSLLRNPFVFLAAGIAAGYLLFKYEKEIIQTVGKLTGMGKDFVAHQKENLEDLIAETKSPDGASVPAAASAQTQE